MRWVSMLSLALVTGCATPGVAPELERTDRHDARPVVSVPRVPPPRPALPAGRTVNGAVRRARLAGHLDAARAKTYRRLHHRARRLVRRLDGRRRVELAAVVGTLDALASQRRLTASRMPLAFLTLRRNLEVWTRGTLPAPGARLTFGRDPVVFQAFSGQGVQHHPLATAGRANALARPCLHPSKAQGAPRCRPRALRRTLDRLVTLASRRGDSTAWEYLFAYGGGSAPWVSGMTQGTVVQALARGARVLGRARYLRVAEDAVGIFEARPPLGVRVDVPGGRHYVMYSFNAELRILNGFLQSVVGLHDLARISGDARARRAFRRGESAARRAVAAYDTGAWSLYASGGRESTLGYHRLVRSFLGGLCSRTRRSVYCDAGRRFGRYLAEPPRVRLAVLARTRVRRAQSLAFSLSKIARVAVSVRGPRGTALRRELTLPRGEHRMAWLPGRRGAYRVRVSAVGLGGPRRVVRRTVRVLPPPRPKSVRRKKPKVSPPLRVRKG